MSQLFLTEMKRLFSEYEDKSKLRCWSKKNKLSPSDFSISSNKKAWFDCSKCGHDFEKSIQNIYRLNRWCPYCAGKKLCGDINCSICIPKSFYGIHDKEKVLSWSNKNDIDPWMVFRGTPNKYIFNCKKCHHEFEMSPECINRENGSWCPFCANQKLCKDPRKCETCLSKTFYESSHTMAINAWSEKNTLKPWEVFINSSICVTTH